MSQSEEETVNKDAGISQAQEESSDTENADSETSADVYDGYQIETEGIYD